MPDFVTAIAGIRESVVGIMRIQPVPTRGTRGGRPKPPGFSLSFVGTGFCIVRDRILFTANHIFNNGNARNQGDRFYAFYAPGNGQRAFNREIVGFPYADPAIDMAAIEMAPPQAGQPNLAACSVTFADVIDGTSALTYGFPAPGITGANLGPGGQWLGGNLSLMSYANEGLVSAKYIVNNTLNYEFNINWHHGESGGPILRLTDQPAVFAMMQGYRNVATPHGTVAGPHIGRALRSAEATLRQFGAHVVD
jgi:Trypsin-like peptidase domain